MHFASIKSLHQIHHLFYSQKKYFGIVTNLGGSQEGAIAPLFDNVTCQANANATDYCFESIMRYGGGDGTPEQASLKYEMHYIAHINKVNFYNATPSTNTHQRIIRIKVPNILIGFKCIK